METETAPTQSDTVKQTTRPEVSWENINFDALNFSDEYSVCLGATGQLVRALRYLYEQLEDTKKATNKYQETLYPGLVELAKEIVSEYTLTFTNDVVDDLQKQVFGANLNGARNTGTLRHPVSTKGVKRGLHYKFAEFGQLLKVLTQRLEYIASRDVDGADRYKTDLDQRAHFLDLQSRAKLFLEYLNGSDTNETQSSVASRWSAVVSAARATGEFNTGTKGVKSQRPASKRVSRRVVYERHYAPRVEQPTYQRGYSRYTQRGFTADGYPIFDDNGFKFVKPRRQQYTQVYSGLPYQGNVYKSQSDDAPREFRQRPRVQTRPNRSDQYEQEYQPRHQHDETQRRPSVWRGRTHYVGVSN
jgi:hypothetical protein